VDFLVVQGLSRAFGLIALRDVLRHFTFHTQGLFALGPAGEPRSMPDWILVPHDRSPRMTYRCPQGCPAESEVWGRPGLHLTCGDCGRDLIPMWTAMQGGD
jgi:hypothetical protein